MEFKANIRINNAAFDEPNTGAEIARILRQIAEELENETKRQHTKTQTLKDINGNRIGGYSIKKMQ